MGKSIDVEAELHDDDFTGFTVTVTYDYRYEYKYKRLQATATRFYRQSERVTRHWVEHGCPDIEVFDFSEGDIEDTGDIPICTGTYYYRFV
jgi:hypothetical protein